MLMGNSTLRTSYQRKCPQQQKVYRVKVRLSKPYQSVLGKLGSVVRGRLARIRETDRLKRDVVMHGRADDATFADGVSFYGLRALPSLPIPAARLAALRRYKCTTRLTIIVLSSV